MKNRKIIVVFLVIAASGIWIYDISLFFRNKRSVDSGVKEPVSTNTIPEKYEFLPDFPDPFVCRYFIPDKKKTVEKKRNNDVAKKKEVILPSCSIGGIIYTSENPMAIFVSGKKSQLVKPGDMVDSITIISITPQNVNVSYRGQKFTITQ